MAEDMVRKLQAIDSAILTDVVRQDQRSPLFEVTEWSVRRLSDKGVTNPDGLWLFRGDGYDKEGSRSWSVVLKILQRQDPEPPLSDLWHWKREFFVAQSGLLARLPGPVKAPGCGRSMSKPSGLAPRGYRRVCLRGSPTGTVERRLSDQPADAR